jgi:diketogulonate reductase-like aldo/keto reductase
VTTKLWNSDHGYDQAISAFNQSLDKLGLDYIDLYLIHWPVEGKRLASWQALETLLVQDRCRAIGVSNYMVRHLEELLDQCKVVPAVNQIELSPYNYNNRKEVIDHCRSKDILVQAYSPLTKGHKLPDPNLAKIASKYSKSPAQVLIRWALQHGFNVLPKSSSRERMAENFDVFDFSISREDMDYLDSLGEGLATSWDPTNAP